MSKIEGNSGKEEHENEYTREHIANAFEALGGVARTQLDADLNSLGYSFDQASDWITRPDILNDDSVSSFGKKFIPLLTELTKLGEQYDAKNSTDTYSLVKGASKVLAAYICSTFG